MNTTLLEKPACGWSRAEQIGRISKSQEFLGQNSSRLYFKQVLATQTPLLLGDLLAYSFCFWLASILGSLVGGAPLFATGMAYLGVMFGLVVSFYAMKLYHSCGMHPIYEFRQCTIGISIVYALIAATMWNSEAFVSTMISYPIMLVVMPFWRSLMRRSLSKKEWWGVRSLVLDCDRRLNSLYGRHLKNTTTGLRPVGFLQGSLPDDANPEYRKLFLGSVDHAGEQSLKHKAFCAIVHRRGRPDHEIFSFVQHHLKSFARVIVVPDDHRLPSLWTLGSTGGISLEDRLLNPTSQVLKRAMDLTLCIVGLIALSPLLLFIVSWIKITSPGPVFFGHERIGKHGRKFKAWKFRSMVTNAKEILEKTLAENPAMREEWEATQKLQNDPRITAPGRLLRKNQFG